MEASGQVLSLDLLTRGTQHRVLAVHAETGALVWDLRYDARYASAARHAKHASMWLQPPNAMQHAMPQQPAMQSMSPCGSRLHVRCSLLSDLLHASENNTMSHWNAFNDRYGAVRTESVLL